MPFKIKRASDILTRLIDNTLINTDKINDFTPGGATRTIYEAVSLVIEQFFTITKRNIEDSIERSVYEAFDYHRREAQRAYGNIQINFNNEVGQDIRVPRGSTFATGAAHNNLQFETIVEYVIPKGSMSAVMEVYCTQYGTIGNIPRNAITRMENPLNNVRIVTNPIAFQTGTEEESKEAVQQRFHNYIESRGRGTIASINYATRLVEEVSGVYVDERPGLIRVYAHDRNGNLSMALQEAIRQMLEDYRPAGIPVQVRPIVRKGVDVTVTVFLKDRERGTETFNQQVGDLIRNHINGHTANQNLILTDLIFAIRDFSEYIYDVHIENLDDNIVTTAEELLRANEVVVKFQ